MLIDFVLAALVLLWIATAVGVGMLFLELKGLKRELRDALRDRSAP